jgi:hypothetical protein
LPTAIDAIPNSLTLWLDASDTSTISLNGSEVTQWNDKSGNGYNFAQSTSNKRPLSGTRTQNTLNVIDFDGTNDSLSTTAAKSAFNFLHRSTSTIFVVLKQDAVNNIKSILNTGLQTFYSNEVGFFVWSNSPSTYQIGVSNASSIVAQINAGFNETTPRYDSIKSDPANATAADRLKYSKNGGAFSGTNTASASITTADSSYNFMLGNSANSETTPMDGWIGEVIIYNSILSAGDTTSVQTYIAAKWGI